MAELKRLLRSVDNLKRRNDVQSNLLFDLDPACGSHVPAAAFPAKSSNAGPSFSSRALSGGQEFSDVKSKDRNLEMCEPSCHLCSVLG